jgi:hypothetical protein
MTTDSREQAIPSALAYLSLRPADYSSSWVTTSEHQLLYVFLFPNFICFPSVPLRRLTCIFNQRKYSLQLRPIAPMIGRRLEDFCKKPKEAHEALEALEARDCGCHRRQAEGLSIL